jgi:hypothetical protein
MFNAQDLMSPIPQLGVRLVRLRGNKTIPTLREAR